MKIKKVSHFDDVTGYMEAWQELAAHQPMMSPQWIIPWWRSYCENSSRAELCLLIGLDDGQLVGIAPFYVVNKRLTKKLRFLGDGHVCSDHMTLLSQVGCCEAFTAEVANWLSNNAGKTWNAAKLESVDTDDVAMRKLVNQLDRESFSVYHRDSVSSWQVALPPTWEEYLSRLSKNHRKRCRKWHRDWIASEKLQFECVTRLDRLDEAFDHVCRLHNARRGSLGSSGVFEDESFHAFHKDCARELMATGQLRINLLMSDAQPIAAEYQLISPDAVFSYQSGVDPEFLEIGAGNISIMMSIRTAIDDGCQTYDLLRGNEPYKKSWSARESSAFDIHIHQKTMNGSLAHVTLGTQDWLRSVRSVVTGGG